MRAHSESHKWSDIVVIVTGVALLAMAIWPGEPTASGDAASDLRVPGMAWIAHIVAGALAITSAFLAQWWGRRPLARILLVGAAILLAAVLLVSGTFDLRSMLTLGLPALLLLVSVFGIGPLGRPGAAPSPR